MSEQKKPEVEEKTEAEIAAEIAAQAAEDADKALDEAEELAVEAEEVNIDELQAAFDEADKELVKASKALVRATEKVRECEAAQVAAGSALEAAKPKADFGSQIQRHLESQRKKAQAGKLNPIDVAGRNGPSPMQQ